MLPPGYRFRLLYPDRTGLFVAGRLVCDYRQSGRCWRVRQYFPNSLEVYRTTLVSSEGVARDVAVELAAAAAEYPGQN